MDPTLISNPAENQWVVEITKILDHQIETTREFPSVSIFRLPESITTKKPEAYEPQQVGLGPIHHFRPNPYKKMEQQKLLVARKYLHHEIKKKEDGKLSVLINKVGELVPIARSCYNIFLQDNDESLAMIFAIDGLFLLDLFQTYNIGMGEKEAYLLLLKEKACEYKRRWLARYGPTPEEELENRGHAIKEFAESCTNLPDLLRREEIVVTSKNRHEFEDALGLPHQRFRRPKFSTKRRKFVQDIMMVENQIPIIVLKEIKEGLHLHPSSSGSFSPSEFRNFCKIHSPLKLCSKSQAPTHDVDHVLHYLYHSIVNNYYTTPPAPDLIPMTMGIDDLRSILEPATTAIINPINFISKVPKEEIVQVYEKTVSILESFTQTKILIPSASKLHHKAGFIFHGLTKHQGIKNIFSNDNEIYLPCVTLNSDSEVILRNLVAYETLTADPDKLILTEYMGLMCALIVNTDDVQYLRDQKVIDGEMGNDQVAKLFIGMSSSIQPIKTEKKSKLQKLIDEVNTVYDNRFEMKIHLLLKKLARWLLVGLKSIGKFVEQSWKIFAFMIGIVTVLTLTYQAYCDVYGCDEKAVTLLPYASS